VHPLVPAVLFRMARFDALDLDAQAQPPDRQLAEPVELESQIVVEIR
jgi:hypothetical protein